MAEDAIVPLMHALVRGIDESRARRDKVLPDDWQSFSLAVGLTDEGEYADSHGYAYGPDDTWVTAISAEPTVIDEPLEAFVAERYPDGAKPAVKVLFQLELATGNYNVEYEDTDASRWKPTPSTYRDVQAELKPTFDD